MGLMSIFAPNFFQIMRKFPYGNKVYWLKILGLEIRTWVGGGGKINESQPFFLGLVS